MKEWIKSTDYLPSEDKKVLVWNAEYDEPEYVDIGYYDPLSCPKTGWRNDEYMNISVTHWMPLPEPPK